MLNLVHFTNTQTQKNRYYEKRRIKKFGRPWSCMCVFLFQKKNGRPDFCWREIEQQRRHPKQKGLKKHKAKHFERKQLQTTATYLSLISLFLMFRYSAPNNRNLNLKFHFVLGIIIGKNASGEPTWNINLLTNTWYWKERFTQIEMI